MLFFMVYSDIVSLSTNID